MKNIKKFMNYAVVAMTFALVLMASPLVAKAYESDLQIKETAYTQNSVTLTWKNVSGAYAYEVEVGTTSLGFTKANTATITGLTPGVVKYVYITAYDSSARSIGSDSFKMATVPSVTDIFLYEWKPGTSASSLKFAGTYSSYYNGFLVEVYDAKAKLIVNANITPGNYKSYDGWKFSSSKIKDKGYSVRVKPYNVDGNNQRIEGSWTKVKAVFPQPKMSGKYKLSRGKQINTLKWKKFKGIKKYTVYGYKGYDGKPKKQKTVKGNSFTKVTPIGSYYYYVIANGMKIKTIEGTKKGNSTQDLKVWTIRF